MPGNLTPEERAALRASNDVEARAEANETVAGVDCYLFDPLEGVLEEECIASFTTITPLPMKFADDFLAAKRAELEHSHRELFRKKLAWFFGREADDIPDHQRIDPPASEATEDRSPGR